MAARHRPRRRPLLITSAALVFAVVASARANRGGGAPTLSWACPSCAPAPCPRCSSCRLLLVTGLGDLGGNAFFVLAARADALSVAVVLSSLYPVVTTLLAALFLRERLRPLQIVGVVLASLSVPLLR